MHRFTTFNISYNQDKDIDQNNIPMEMYLFDNYSVIPQKIVTSSGKIKRIEEGYLISLYKLTPGKNKRDNIISILNMKPSSNYLLLIPNEMINENNKGKQRVELFLNNEYQGNYTIDGIEEIPHKQ